MKSFGLAENLAAPVMASLLILTAWGSASAMFLFAALGLIVGFVPFRHGEVRGGVLVAAVGFATAIAIGLALWTR